MILLSLRMLLIIKHKNTEARKVTMTFFVKRAQYAGACYGVQRALDMTNKAAQEQESVCTLGPLIHNPRVVADLESRGIVACDDIEDIESRAVVIRSHGVAPEVLSSLHDRGRTVIDATCPHVMRAQQAAAKMAKQGYHVLVVGEAGHPEVEGISACARSEGGQCTIVDNPEDLPQTLGERIGVVVQTTQSREKLDAIVKALEQRGIEPLVKDTICFATAQRQQSAAELAEEADCMVVIGGRNSSNTTRLFELCLAHGKKAYHVEGPEEIDPSWFEDCGVVGVTAGASTPEEQIDAVISAIESVSTRA